MFTANDTERFDKGRVTIMFDTVKKIILEQFDVDEDDITYDTSLADDLDADSLELVELLLAFEDEFDVKIPDEEAESLKTVGDIVKYIEEKSAE